MGTLKEELEKLGYMGSPRKKEKDKIPDIEIYDKEIAESFQKTVDDLDRSRYRSRKAQFPYKRKSGEVKIWEVDPMTVKFMNKESQTYKAMELLYALSEPASIDTMYENLVKDIPEYKRSSLGSYIAKFAQFGVAKKSIIDNKVFYEKADFPHPDIAYAKYLQLVKKVTEDKKGKPKMKKPPTTEEPKGEATVCDQVDAIARVKDLLMETLEGFKTVSKEIQLLTERINIADQVTQGHFHTPDGKVAITLDALLKLKKG